jgi:hypothetical protein
MLKLTSKIAFPIYLFAFSAFSNASVISEENAEHAQNVQVTTHLNSYNLYDSGSYMIGYESVMDSKSMVSLQKPTLFIMCFIGVVLLSARKRKWVQ